MKKKPNCTDEYLVELIVAELIDTPDYIFCSTCITYVRKAKFPRLNINHSNLRFPEVPDVVKNLNPLAERCVSPRMRLTILNVYNNPASNLDLLKTAMTEISEYINETDDILLMGDFNYQLKHGNQLESFLHCNFGFALMSPRESTTNAGTIIDGVFGKLKNFEAQSFIYESYASHHKPIIMRLRNKF